VCLTPDSDSADIYIPRDLFEESDLDTDRRHFMELGDQGELIIKPRDMVIADGGGKEVSL